MIDIRIPIGFMFSLLGLLLLVYGFSTATDVAMYQKSFGNNINLYSGGLMLVFGGFMLFRAFYKKRG
ncbi:MAG: hypothetical protein WCO63_04730 [Bacteroidota bacterium]